MFQPDIEILPRSDLRKLQNEKLEPTPQTLEAVFKERTGSEDDQPEAAANARGRLGRTAQSGRAAHAQHGADVGRERQFPPGAWAEEVAPHLGRAFVVGITGWLRVGESTLTAGLISELRKQSLKVAVLAADPSSKRAGARAARLTLARQEF